MSNDATKPDGALPWPEYMAGPGYGEVWEKLAVPTRLACMELPKPGSKRPPRALLTDSNAIEAVLAGLHEMEHRARAADMIAAGYLTPDSPLHNEFIHMCEEVAVDVSTRQRGLILSCARDELDIRADDLPTDRIEAALDWLQLVESVYPTDGGPGTQHPGIRARVDALNGAMSDGDRTILLSAQHVLGNDWSCANCVAVARALAEHFGTPTPAPEPRLSKDAEQRRAEERQARQDAAAAHQREDRREQPVSVLEVDKLAPGNAVKPLYVCRHTCERWGRPIRSKQWRPADQGRPKAVLRTVQGDPRFAERRAPGGVMLVDVSSSMSQSILDEVHATIETLPGLVAAVYCGCYDPDAGVGWAAQPYVGVTCVIAEKGWVARAWPQKCGAPMGQGNYSTGADYAALLWTTQQRQRPIVWVSDGQTGPQGDWANIAALMPKAGIVRVMTVADALDYLQGHVVLGWRDHTWTIAHDGTNDREGQPIHK